MLDKRVILYFQTYGLIKDNPSSHFRSKQLENPSPILDICNLAISIRVRVFMVLDVDAIFLSDFVGMVRAQSEMHASHVISSESGMT